MIDAAILRRGRFDRVINVDFANETEVLALLEHLRPHCRKMTMSVLAHSRVTSPAGLCLTSRSLSGRAHVSRPGRERRSSINQVFLRPFVRLRRAPARATPNAR